VSFVPITLCVASQQMFIVVVYFVTAQSGNFWIHPRTFIRVVTGTRLVATEIAFFVLEKSA
jgi:hypothetical protein